MRFAWRYSASVLTFISMEYKFKSGKCYRKYFFFPYSGVIVRYMASDEPDTSVCEIPIWRQAARVSLWGVSLESNEICQIMTWLAWNWTCQFLPAWLKNQFLFTFKGNYFPIFFKTWNGG